MQYFKLTKPYSLHSEFLDSFLERCQEQTHEVPIIEGARHTILDPHQRTGMLAICDALDAEEQINSFSIVHPTGSGKTVLEANLLLASQRAREAIDVVGNDLIITTERALIHGIGEELDKMGIEHGVWGAGRKRDIDNTPVTLATIQALQSASRRKMLSTLPLDNMHLVIGDEADEFLTTLRSDLISRIPQALRIGFTATPEWPDGRIISDLWGEIVHHVPLKEGILRGINVPPYFELFEAELDDSELKVLNEEYDPKVLAAEMKKAEIEKAIPEVYEALVPADKRKEFPTLIYVASVELVHSTTELLRKRYEGEGLSIRSWTGESTSTPVLRQDIRDHDRGDVDILVLHKMGKRGINLRRARCLIDAFPCLSPTTLEQRHGRIARIIREGSLLAKLGFEKPFALVAQIIPKSNRFRPYLLPDLLDCWDDYRERRLLATRPYRESDSPDAGPEDSAAQRELEEIKRHLAHHAPKHHVRHVKEIDVYEQLKRRDQLPTADENGFFNIGSETYGTCGAWARILPISRTALERRVMKKPGITGKTNKGRVMLFGYHPKTQVLEVCADLLEELPKADNEGFIHVPLEEGGPNVRLGTSTAWKRIMGLADITIRKRLGNTLGMTAKDQRGHVREGAFYEESVVREACANLLDPNMLQANSDGFIHLEVFGPRREGEEDTAIRRLGSLTVWANELGIARGTIAKNLSKAGIKGITAKDQVERISENAYFEESDVREACADHLADLRVANDDNILILPIPTTTRELEFERWAPVSVWTKILGKSDDYIRKRIDKSQTMKAKTKGGAILDFYPESHIKEVCAELERDLLRAGKDGFVVLPPDDERYAPVGVWRDLLGIGKKAIDKAMKGTVGMTARDRNGIIREKGFYAESDVRRELKDHLDDSIPVAGKDDGFFTLKEDGAPEEMYGDYSAWARRLSVTSATIKSTLKKAGKTGIKGKDRSGSIKKGGFFSETDMKAAAPDLFLEGLPTAEDGFFEENEVMYGIASAWAKIIPVTTTTIGKRLKKAGKPSKKARTSTGVRVFYSEADVYEVCADLILKRG